MDSIDGISSDSNKGLPLSIALNIPRYKVHWTAYICKEIWDFHMDENLKKKNLVPYIFITHKPRS
jgi:hypothetical protein